MLYSGLVDVCYGQEKVFFTSNTESKASYLLLHGYGSNIAESSTIKGVGDSIVQNDHVAHWAAIDYYGHGNSTGTLSDGFSVTKIIEGVESYIDQQCNKDCVVFGNSLGGLIAFLISVRRGNPSVCMAPPLCLLESHELARAIHAPDSFIKDLHNYSELCNMDASRSIIVFGTSDEIVQYDSNMRVASKCKAQPIIEIMPGVRHFNHASSTIDRLAALCIN